MESKFSGDYYSILGVDKTASIDDLQRAYRKQLKRFHPDLHEQDPQMKSIAEEKTKEILEAFRILKGQRADYDQWFEENFEETSYEQKRPNTNQDQSDIKSTEPEKKQEPICLDHLLGKLEQPGAKLIKEIVWRDYLRRIENLGKTNLLYCDAINKDIPTILEVLISILHQITPKQLKMIRNLKVFSKPGLILKPILPLEYLISTLESPLSSMQDQRDPLHIGFVPGRSPEKVFELCDKHHGVKKFLKWQVSIGETVSYPNNLGQDYGSENLEEKLEWFINKYSKLGIQPMGLNSYVLLLHDSLFADNPIDSCYDDESITFLADEPRLFDAFIGGKYNARRKWIHLGHYSPTLHLGSNRNVRIRPELVFDILKSHPYDRLLKAIGNFPYFEYTSL